MTRLERLKDQLDTHYRIRDMLLRSGRYLEAAETTRRIREVEAEVKAAEEYERLSKPVPVTKVITSERLDELGLIPLLIEAHLAADFLTGIAYAISDICKKEGFEQVIFSSDLQDILKKCDVFASALIRLCPNLTELLTENETLNMAVHKKYVSYITQKAKKCDSKKEKKKKTD